MKIAKIIGTLASAGAAVVGFGTKALDFADHIIHRKEYEALAAKKRRNRIIGITLGIIGGVVAILLFPYKFVVEKNGDFEIRTLLLRIYRKTEDYDLPEGGSEAFDIEDAEDGEVVECELIEAED
ncbi:MAG: hypothetical protein E7645_03040 [Ruminococcaceae bacterium]|nr:hypothetical protein [Oscillospiraceae bacterium]